MRVVAMRVNVSIGGLWGKVASAATGRNLSQMMLFPYYTLADHALRRRFAFVELAPNMAVLRHYHAGSGYDPEPLIALLAEVNRAIEDPRYALGITYFLRPDLAQSLPAVWELEVVPFLAEYFFDQPEVVDGFRWPAVAERFAA